jgi:hypothetical protein
LGVEPPKCGDNVFGYDEQISCIYVPKTAVDAYKTAYGWRDYTIIGISNVGNEEVPVYVASNIVDDGTIQDAREEVSFDFVEYSEVFTGQGTATLTCEGSSNVVNLPAAQIMDYSEANAKVRAVRMSTPDDKDYQVVQPLGDAATADGIYTIHFPEGYFLLGTEKGQSPAFIMSFTIGDVAGVSDITVNDTINANTIVDVYNLSGAQVIKGVEMGSVSSLNLNTGIYIVRSANAVKKIVIR